MSMKRIVRNLALSLAGLGALAGGVFAVSAFAQLPSAPGQPELKAGDPAPDFTLQASDGKTYSLSKLRGRAVVLAWFPKAFTAG
jgi:thioredoxin-dependent peroxiredoxin